MPSFKLTRLDGEVSPQMYTSMQQHGGLAGTSAIMLRTKPGARAIPDRTRAILLNLEKGMSLIAVSTMAQVRWKLLASERFRTAVLLVFAGTATFLALIGFFGLVSFTLAQRHREIGLRVALGATYSGVVSIPRPSAPPRWPAASSCRPILGAWPQSSNESDPRDPRLVSNVDPRDPPPVTVPAINVT